MTLTNFPNGISSFGIPMVGGVPFGPTSKVFFVHGPSAANGGHGSDGNNGLSARRPFKTISKAHSAMTAGNNDVCFVMGNGAISGNVAETATIAWSKNACHLIGVAAPGLVSQRARISAPAGDVTPIMNITGDGCMFSDLHLFQDFSTNAANVCVAMSGQRNVFLRTHIAGGGNATAAVHAGTRSLTIAGGGGEHYFKDCVIGLDTIPRGTAASAEIELTGATPRNMFEDCIILSRTDGAAHDQLLIGTGGIDRWVIFKNSVFWNDTQGGGTKADEHLNVVAGAGGIVLLEKTTTFGATAIETVKHGSVYQSLEATSIATVLS